MRKTIILNLFNRDINFSPNYIAWYLEPLDIIYLYTDVKDENKASHFISNKITPILFACKSCHISIVVLIDKDRRLDSNEKSLTGFIYEVYASIRKIRELFNHKDIDLVFIFNGKSPWHAYDHLNKTIAEPVGKNPYYILPSEWPSELQEMINEISSKDNNLESVLLKTDSVLIDAEKVLDDGEYLSVIQMIDFLDFSETKKLRGKALSILFEKDETMNTSLFNSISDFTGSKIKDLESLHFNCTLYDLSNFDPKLDITSRDIESIISIESDILDKSVVGVSKLRMSISNQLIDSISFVANEKKKFIKKLNFSQVSRMNKSVSMVELKGIEKQMQNEVQKIKMTIAQLQQLEKDQSSLEDEYKQKCNEILVKLNNEVQKIPNKIYFKMLVGFSFLFFIVVSLTLLYNEVYKEPLYLLTTIIYVISIIFTYRKYIKLNQNKIEKLIREIQSLQNTTATALFNRLNIEFALSFEYFKLMVLGENQELLRDIDVKYDKKWSTLSEVKKVIDLNIKGNLGAKANSGSLIMSAKADDFFKENIIAKAPLKLSVLGSIKKMMVPLSSRFNSVTLEEKTSWV